MRLLLVFHKPAAFLGHSLLCRLGRCKLTTISIFLVVRHIPCPCSNSLLRVSIIWRLIARVPDKMRHAPVRLQAGLRRYLCTCIDPHSRFALALAAATASSRHATHALDALCHLLPAPPRFLLSDNGAECLGHFQQRLDERGITHWWIYPCSPKMNAHVERFNRTLQEQFVDYHEDLLVDDLAAFNRKLADWLLAYNTVLRHAALAV